MQKKLLKITIFLMFVLVLFSSCARKVEKCKIFPKIELDSKKNSESDKEKMKNRQQFLKMIKNRKTYAHVSCIF